MYMYITISCPCFIVFDQLQQAEMEEVSQRKRRKIGSSDTASVSIILTQLPNTELHVSPSKISIFRFLQKQNHVIVSFILFIFTYILTYCIHEHTCTCIFMRHSRINSQDIYITYLTCMYDLYTSVTCTVYLFSILQASSSSSGMANGVGSSSSGSVSIISSLSTCTCTVVGITQNHHLQLRNYSYQLILSLIGL